jgi:hypothetical protein
MSLDTTGGDSVTIGGTNFGPFGTIVTATYGPYTATGCATTTADSAITCKTAAGAGMGYAWVVQVGGQRSVDSDATTSYGLPIISGVVAMGPMPTLGGASVVLQGTNFGPVGTAITATYGMTLELRAACL